MIRVVVGSKNPVKVEAVRQVFEEYFANVQVVGVEVETGVDEQPRSEEETRQGAINRAKAALADNDYAVGLEGGVCEVAGRLFECAWVAVIKRQSEKSKKKKEIETIGLGGGLYFEIPPKVARRIRAGEELGPIMAELMEYDVRRTDGAIGVLSKGGLTRTQAYEQIVKMAMLKFVSGEWWGQE